ncbi:Crp/Fnr family transcriptional regulator [Clostridium sp. LP20]|uniref:Crp/Fnr family transcriptional regulator n=1 Tax=Clostridium sp. LP20 TaxID=3418665 RepID=UPI003EE70A8D
MKNNIDKLIKNDFFRNMDRESIGQVISRIRFSEVSYKKGEIIAHEEEPCNNIGLILEGTVHIERIYTSGKGILLKKLVEGDVFGEAIVISMQSTYPATVVALSDCKIMFIKKQEILKLCSEEPVILENFISLLSNKIIMLNAKIKSISLKSIRHKVIDYLLEEHQDQGSLIIELKDSKEEIASGLGIPRPSLSRELIKLREDGFINFDRKTVTILKIEELEEELFD